MRTALDRNNGSLAASGAVSRLFSRKAHFLITGDNADEDKLMELVLDAGAEDIEVEDGIAEIWGAPESFQEIADILEKKETTIRSLLKRGREKLANMIARENKMKGDDGHAERV